MSTSCQFTISGQDFDAALLLICWQLWSVTGGRADLLAMFDVLRTARGQAD